MERDSHDKRRTDGSNGCKISGLRRARTQQPTRVRNPGEHGVGSATDMGSGDQRRQPQDCIKIQIQSQPRCGVYPQSIVNTRHSGCRVRPKKRKGAGRIGGHVQLGDDQGATVGIETA